MADLDFTSANVRNATPEGWGVVIDMIASVAISAGQAVYNTSGKAALADASAAGTAVCVGIALESVAANQVVPVLALGYVSGFTLTSLSYGALVTVSDTAGDLDSGGSPTVSAPVGRVWNLTDSSLTKVLFVNCLYNLNVVPA